MKLQIVLFMLKKNSEQFNYRIYYEDTDAGGVVYYANYLKFFERARSDFLRSIGISQVQLAQSENIIFVVKRCIIDYQSPARLDDEITVSVKIKEIHKVSLTMKQEIFGGLVAATWKLSPNFCKLYISYSIHMKK